MDQKSSSQLKGQGQRLKSPNTSPQLKITPSSSPNPGPTFKHRRPEVQPPVDAYEEAMSRMKAVKGTPDDCFAALDAQDAIMPEIANATSKPAQKTSTTDQEIAKIKEVLADVDKRLSRFDKQGQDIEFLKLKFEHLELRERD